MRNGHHIDKLLLTNGTVMSLKDTLKRKINISDQENKNIHAIGRHYTCVCMHPTRILHRRIFFLVEGGYEKKKVASPEKANFIVQR